MMSASECSTCGGFVRDTQKVRTGSPCEWQGLARKGASYRLTLHFPVLPRLH